MKTIVIAVFTLTMLFGLSYFVFYPFLTKEPVVAVTMEATAPVADVNYRDVTFYVEDLNSDTEYFVKVDYPGVEEAEQYLIDPVLDKSPEAWEAQDRIPLSTRLEEGKKYSVVTKSYDKKLVEAEELTIQFNNFVYEEER